MLTVLLILATTGKVTKIMQDVKLKPAGYKDLDAISKLAKVTWNQHYPSIISQAQIDYMLGLMYSTESLTEQMKEKGHQFYLINSGYSTVGFISVTPEKNNEWFLNKFYIDQELASRGIGSRSFEELKKILSPKKITLTVNRQNFKTINFYFKTGFKIARVADFDIGNGYVMNDFVMVWEG
jgi:ribosomal protein S18 acetylase RimI-like enzyme